MMLNSYSSKQKKEIIKKGLRIVKQNHDIKSIKSFRAGRWSFSSDLPGILAEMGFTHDSSIYPNAFSKNIPKKMDGVIEISPTIWSFPFLKIIYLLGIFKILKRIGRWDSGGFIFSDIMLTKNLDRILIYVTKRMRDRLDYLVFTFHSYDLLDVKTFKKIEDYISFCKKEDGFITISGITA